MGWNKFYITYVIILIVGFSFIVTFPKNEGIDPIWLAPKKFDYVKLVKNTPLCSNNCEQIYQLTKTENMTIDFNIIVKDLIDKQDYDGVKITDKIETSFKKNGMDFLYDFKLEYNITEEYTIGHYETCLTGNLTCWIEDIYTREAWKETDAKELKSLFENMSKNENIDIRFTGKLTPDSHVDLVISYAGFSYDEYADWEYYQGGLMYYYKLNNLTQSGLDARDSINHPLNNATGVSITGSEWEDSINTTFKKAIHLDGSADYFDTGIKPNANSFTIEALVNHDATSGSDEIISSMDTGPFHGFMMRWASDNKVNCYVCTGAAAPNAVSDNAIGNGGWTRFTCTYDGTTIKMYVNGTLQADTGTGTFVVGTKSIFIGGAQAGQSEGKFDGLIDDVRIWNVTLTQQNITDMWSEEFGPIPNTAPAIALESPDDNNISSDSTPDFIFNVTDPEAGDTLSATLLIANVSEIDYDQTVYYWKFDDDLTESFGGVNTLVGNVEGYITGKVGNAVSFELGDTDYVTNESLDTVAIQLVRTITWWVKPETWTGDVKPFGLGDLGVSNALFCDGAEHLKFVLDSWPDLLATDNLVADTWTMITIVMNSSGSYLYINGSTTPDDTGVSDYISGTADSIRFGTWTLSSEYHYDGAVDNFYMTEQEFGAAEITEAWNSGDGRDFSTSQFIPYGENTSVFNGISTTITANASLDDGSYKWKINASDGTTTNVSETRNINISTIVPDTCNPTSPLTADHTFNCSDHCNQTTALDAGGYSVFVLGNGSFTITADITNYNNKSKAEGLDSTNICRVTCIGGCFR